MNFIKCEEERKFITTVAFTIEMNKYTTPEKGLLLLWHSLTAYRYAIYTLVPFFFYFLFDNSIMKILNCGNLIIKNLMYLSFSTFMHGNFFKQAVVVFSDCLFVLHYYTSTTLNYFICYTPLVFFFMYIQ